MWCKLTIEFRKTHTDLKPCCQGCFTALHNFPFTSYCKRTVLQEHGNRCFPAHSSHLCLKAVTFSHIFLIWKKKKEKKKQHYSLAFPMSFLCLFSCFILLQECLNLNPQFSAVPCCSPLLFLWPPREHKGRYEEDSAPLLFRLGWLSPLTMSQGPRQSSMCREVLMVAAHFLPSRPSKVVNAFKCVPFSLQ